MRLTNSRRGGRRRRLALVGSALALTAGVLVAAPTSALPTNLFELDSNIADGAAAGDDWLSLFNDNDGPAGGSVRYTGAIDDFYPGNDPTTFTGGHSKDDLFIEGADPNDATDGWLHVAGSTPDKAELENAFAAAYLAPDGGDPGTEQDLILFFGADREAVNGSTNVGFWFTKQSIAPRAAGDFSGVHENGDTLVLSEFTNGGGTPGVQVWQWAVGVPPDAGKGTCPSNLVASNVGCKDNDGTLKLLFLGAGNCGSASACAVVNSGPVTGVPWDYDPKAGSTPNGTYPAAAFIEGGVNISALSGGGQPCISNFLAETRSSPSIDAVLLDFARGDFQLCGASVTIAGNDINQVGDAHTFTVTANQTFAGSTSPAAVANVDVTLTSANGASPVVDTDASTCDDGQPDGDNVDANGQCTIVFTSATPGTVTGSATAAVTTGGGVVTVSTNGVAPNSGNVLKRFVDSRISLSPLLDTNGITENHVVTALVEVNLGDGAGWVAKTAGHVDASLTDTLGAVSVVNVGGTTCHISAPEAPPSATPDNLDGSGQCTVAFTSNTAGTVTVDATATVSVTVDGFTQLMTRTTNGSAGNSAVSVKVFKDGMINWIKKDGEGNLLGGATFWVCKTENWNSDTSSYDPIADTNPDPGKDNDSRCIVVADDLPGDPDTEPDADSTAGLFKLVNLTLGTYTIQEKQQPVGYDIDPDTETVQINTTTTSAEPTHVVNGETVPKPFINPKLFKLIVITCNTSTETLVDGTVTLTGTPGADERETIKASELPAGVTEAALCGLAGANYDDLPSGTYAPSVELPDEAPLFP